MGCGRIFLFINFFFTQNQPLVFHNTKRKELYHHHYLQRCDIFINQKSNPTIVRTQVDPIFGHCGEGKKWDLSADKVNYVAGKVKKGAQEKKIPKKFLISDLPPKL